MAGRKKSVLNSELTAMEEQSVIDTEAKIIDDNHQMTTDEILNAQQKNTKKSTAKAEIVEAEVVNEAPKQEEAQTVEAEAHTDSAPSDKEVGEDFLKILENNVNGLQKFFNPKPDRQALSKDGKQYLPDEQIVANIHKNYESVAEDVIAAVFAIEKDYVFNIRYEDYAMCEKDVMWYAIYNTNVLLEKMIKLHKREEKAVERRAKKEIRAEKRSAKRAEKREKRQNAIDDLLDLLDRKAGEVTDNATEAGFDMGGNPATA